MKSNYVAKQSHGGNWLLFYFYPQNENRFRGCVWFSFSRSCGSCSGHVLPNISLPTAILWWKFQSRWIRRKVGMNAGGQRQTIWLKWGGNRSRMLRLCLDQLFKDQILYPMTPVKKHKLFSKLPHQLLVWGHEAWALTEGSWACEPPPHDTRPHGYWWLYQGTGVHFPSPVTHPAFLHFLGLMRVKCTPSLPTVNDSDATNLMSFQNQRLTMFEKVTPTLSEQLAHGLNKCQH